MAAELGTAIGLQGKPRATPLRQVLKDTLYVEGVEEKKNERERAIKQKEEDDLDDIINRSTNVDFNKYHPTDRGIASEAAKTYIKNAYNDYSSGNPISRSKLKQDNFELAENLSALEKSSQEKYQFLNDVKEGMYLDANGENYLKYLTSGNPKYLEGIDLSKGGTILGVDPNSGAATYKNIKPINLVAHATKNYYKDKIEAPAGREGGFDKIETRYDLEGVANNARIDLQTNEPLKDWVSSVFKEKALERTKNIIDPVTGEKRYAEVDEYTLQDPSFMEDYEQSLEDEYVDFALGVSQPKKTRLMRTPRARSSSSSKKGGSGYGSTLIDFGWQQGSDGYYNDGTGERKYTSAWKGSTQPVTMNLSGSEGLFRASDGTFENKTGIQSYQTGETEITPVYTEGINKGKPVPDDRLQTDKGKYQYKALMDLSQTTSTGSGVLKETIVTPYLAPLEKVKSGYLLGLTKDEKESAQAQFKIIEQEIKRLNKELKSDNPIGSNEKPTEPFKIDFNNMGKKKKGKASDYDL